MKVRQVPSGSFDTSKRMPSYCHTGSCGSSVLSMGGFYGCCGNTSAAQWFRLQLSLISCPGLGHASYTPVCLIVLLCCELTSAR